MVILVADWTSYVILVSTQLEPTPYTEGERNAGFNFAIPLGPKRQSKWQGQFIRLRVPHYFSWEYSMLNYYRYAFEHMGVIYKEIPDKSFTTHYWQAAYLEHYLQRFLDNKIN